MQYYEITLINRRFKKMTKTTEQVIYEMLTESTGTNFLDSGGDNGRFWQRNQLRTLEDFKKR